MNKLMNKVHLLKNAVISWFFCKHNYRWVRNVYGDEIYMTGKWKRSWWRCNNCGRRKSSEHLNNTGRAQTCL